MKQHKISMYLSFIASICFSISSVILFSSNSFVAATIYLILAVVWLVLGLRKMSVIRRNK